MTTSFAVASETVRLNETDLCIHTWTPTTKNDTTKSPGLAVVYHGFLAHGQYPTVRYAAEALVTKLGLTVVAADMRGHGRSAGIQGYLSGPDQVVADGVAVAKYACQQLLVQNQTASKSSSTTAKEEETQPLFLVGSSMGGTIALSVAQQMILDKESIHHCKIAGVVLLAPMLKLSVDSVQRNLLLGLNRIFPTWQIIPSKSTDAKEQARNPTRRQECEDDELTVKSSHIRIGSASTCVELAAEIQDEFSSIQFPFLVMVADEDTVVDSQGSVDLYERAPSQEKTMKRYPALHALLCEPSPLVDTIEDDMVAWIRHRL